MSLTKELSDVLKSAQTASSLSGLSMICADSSGLFKKLGLAPILIYPFQDYNANELNATGIYPLASGSTNFPSNPNGNLCFVMAGPDGVIQNFFRFGDDGYSYKRFKVGFTWKNWMLE